jgi:hypothetical protein
MSFWTPRGLRSGHAPAREGHERSGQTESDELAIGRGLTVEDLRSAFVLVELVTR